MRGFIIYSQTLHQQVLAVYDQLVLFYHQNPAKRQTEFD